MRKRGVTTSLSPPQSTDIPSSTPSVPPLHFHLHPDSNPDAPQSLLPDNPSSKPVPVPVVNVVATPSGYPLPLRGNPSHPHNKFQLNLHCVHARGHRPSRLSVWT